MSYDLALGNESSAAVWRLSHSMHYHPHSVVRTIIERKTSPEFRYNTFIRTNILIIYLNTLLIYDPYSLGGVNCSLQMSFEQKLNLLVP